MPASNAQTAPAGKAAARLRCGPILAALLASAMLTTGCGTRGGLVEGDVTAGRGSALRAGTRGGPTASSRGAPPLRTHADPAALERDVRYLASDDLEGRGPGSPGLEQALRYVARRFAELGLTPALIERPRGPDPLGHYLQEFEVAGYPPSANVIGILPGHPQTPHLSPPAATAPRAVIVGAHVDHLGRDGSLTGDQIFNGADDNASGVAALLEVARMLSTTGGNDGAVVFIVFSAEESGRLGSKYYAAHPVIPPAEIMAMINLDSVGKLRAGKLIAFDMASAREFPAILGGLNQAFGLEIEEGSHGVEASDHVSFLDAEIPALHLFTGPHPDFSKVSDHADGINYAGLATLAEYVVELARYLSYRDRPLTFLAPEKAAAEAQPTAAPQSQRRVSLGFMPDFAGDVQGVKVSMVPPGGPAAQAGLQAGDVIVAIDGESLTSLQDYTAILRQHAPGDAVSVKVLRGGAEIVFEATLQERK